jgi:putative endonuclease
LELRRWSIATMPLADLISRVRGRLFPAENLGRRGERAAVKHLKRQGYIILHRSYKILGGELDIVAVDGRTIVFIEVKTRSSHDAGHPAEAVDENKQRQLAQLALAYLRRYQLLDCSARFDVIAVTWGSKEKQPTIQHIKNAFEAPGRGQLFA